MMYIATLCDDQEERVYGWHVGETAPIGQKFICEVSEVQADGDELLWIERNFRNLPIHNTSPVQRWFGEHAKFIVAHLGR